MLRRYAAVLGLGLMVLGGCLDIMPVQSSATTPVMMQHRHCGMVGGGVSDGTDVEASASAQYGGGGGGGC